MPFPMHICIPLKIESSSVSLGSSRLVFHHTSSQDSVPLGISQYQSNFRPIKMGKHNSIHIKLQKIKLGPLPSTLFNQLKGRDILYFFESFIQDSMFHRFIGMNLNVSMDPFVSSIPKTLGQHKESFERFPIIIILQRHSHYKTYMFLSKRGVSGKYFFHTPTILPQKTKAWKALSTSALHHTHLSSNITFFCFSLSLVGRPSKQAL